MYKVAKSVWPIYGTNKSKVEYWDGTIKVLTQEELRENPVTVGPELKNITLYELENGPWPTFVRQAREAAIDDVLYDDVFPLPQPKAVVKMKCMTNEILQEKLDQAKAQGAADERDRIRAEVEHMVTHVGEFVDKKKVLNLLQSNTITQPEILTFDEGEA